MAEVIPMQSVSRTSLESSQAETSLIGFCKALALVKTMLPCSLQETRVSLENWLAAEMITQREFSAVAEFYGWEASAW
jgi:hypothetical protein